MQAAPMEPVVCRWEIIVQKENAVLKTHRHIPVLKKTLAVFVYNAVCCSCVLQNAPGQGKGVAKLGI